MRLKRPALPLHPLALAVSAALLALPATAQDAADAAPSVQPSSRLSTHVGTRVTASDNVNLTSTNRESGLIFEVSPGLDWRYHSARTNVRLGAGLRAATSNSNTTGNSSNLSLDSVLNTALYERSVFLDATARVTQQNPFGTFLPESTSDVNDTQREIRAASISPYTRGRLAGDVEYEARYRATHSSGSQGALENANSNAVSGYLASAPKTGRSYDWRLSSVYEQTEFKDYPSYENAQWLMTVGWRPSPTLRLFGDAGQERNGFRTGTDDVTNPIYDVGAEWNPTARSSLRATYGRRFFGNNYELSAAHRSRLGMVELSRSRSLTNSRNQLFVPFVGTVADGLEQALLSRYPDAGERGLIVDRLIDQYNLPAIVLGPFALLTNRYYVETRTSARASLLGVRNVVTATAYRSDAMATDSAVAADEFAFFGRRMRQRGMGIDWHYIIDAKTSMGANLTRVQSQAIESMVDTRTSALSLTVNRRLGARSSTGLTYRRYDRENLGTGEKARENALIGSYRITF
jgi:uncharacterized protein (PEP-CTERM system associated)